MSDGENVTTVAESKLYISLGKPATNNAAGFAALTWTLIGEITDIGTVTGREYNTSTHAPVASAQQIEKKASYKLGSSEFKMGWDETDEGQQMVDAASKDYSIPSFKLEKQDGAVRYFTAQVSKFTEDNGTVDNVVQGSMTLLRQTDTIRVAAPG
ncbi:hypothetical protein [Duganella phyllosphaerae]|uniref:Uncharacterized protein n=1 Tax=Duganella phyllosphaerae TaxID=762836 RepID=A0A1E7W4S1_9BURK|nr:hypothetical protein [Duganella phyllosphaerae]OEZ90725.1 hypothetical protein DUPY_53320 [Duganella phyllosphaerae]